MKTLYLQIGDSTSTYYLDIVSDFDMDLPSADYKLINTLGEGGIVLGTGVKRGRELGCSYNFVKNKEYERDTFIDWFTKTKDITTYLYKDINKRIFSNLANASTVVYTDNSTLELSTGNAVTGIGISANTVVEQVNTTSVIISNAATATLVNTEVEYQTFLGRMRVYPSASGGEGYKTLRYSDSVKFKLLSASPFFASTTLTTSTHVVASASEFSTTVDISGQRVPAIYDITASTSSTNWNLFQVKLAEGYGFRVDYGFKPGDNVIVNTAGSDLSMTVNGNTVNNAFYKTSTPFLLEGGENTLSIIGTTGAMNIKYYERRL